jgi:hypothetical protein
LLTKPQTRALSRFAKSRSRLLLVKLYIHLLRPEKSCCAQVSLLAPCPLFFQLTILWLTVYESLVSGEAPTTPVASSKSGSVFEKRLIEAYIAEHGKDPVTGEDLSTADLIELKSTHLPFTILFPQLTFFRSLSSNPSPTTYTHLHPLSPRNIPE